MTYVIGTLLHKTAHVVMTIGLVIVLLCPLNVFADSPTELKVKAAFLYHFSQFTEWPDDVLTPEDKHIRLCHFGEASFVHLLEQSLGNKIVQARGFQVLHNVTSTQVRTCHIVFVDRKTSKKPQHMQSIVQQSKGLVVGESNGFLEQGGMVQFFRKDQKIRFAINPDALDKKHIQVSSKLLRLAKIMRSP